MLRILIAHTKHSVDVIEERLLDGIPLFNAETHPWDRIYPYYRRIRGEAEIQNVPRVNLFQCTRERLLSMDMINKFVRIISLCTLVSI